MIPAFVLMEQGKLAEQGIELEYVPSKGASDVMAHLQRGDVDLALYSTPGGSNLYSKGFTSIRLMGTHVWNAIYVVSQQAVFDWSDLVGKRVLIAFRGGPPDLIARASMIAAGYDPDEDFRIEYLDSAEVKRLLLAGQADAAVFPEPHISMLIMKSGGVLKAAIAPQRGFSTTISGWELGEQIMLGSLWAVAPNIEGKEDALEKFIAAFDEANDYAMSHPEEAGEITSRCFAEYFGGQFPAQAIAESIRSGLLLLDYRGVDQIKPLVKPFLETLGFPVPDEQIYYQ
jgi:ABC-type nitrate/sulfonate/bicarbonate transport system substrate-binding protein